MKICFRVDSGKHIGIGHLMRCLTLADQLFKRGHFISIITKKHVGHRLELIPDYIKVYVIDKPVELDLQPENKDNYQSWLGSTIDFDLQQTNKILNEITDVDLVVIDHYSLDASYEKHLLSKQIMVIDDLNNRAHFCDYLLNQNFHATVENYYHQLILKDTSQLLLGPRFAILRPEFRQLREKLNLENKKLSSIKKILVFLGGEDKSFNTLKLANSLNADLLTKYQFTFILNDKNKKFGELKKLEVDNPNRVKVLSFVKEMASLMNEHDLFIGAGGSTSWERMALGIPSVIVSVAENQELICQSLADQNYVIYVGKDFDQTELKWQKFLLNLQLLTNQLSICRQKGFELVDGQGVERIVQVVIGGN